VLTACACMPVAAQAAQTARLQVSLSPDCPGASTTIAFAFQITAPNHALPAALTVLDVRLPPAMGVDTSGLATCTRAALAHGPQGCSPDARVGSGSVDVRSHDSINDVVQPRIPNVYRHLPAQSRQLFSRDS